MLVEETSANVLRYGKTTKSRKWTPCRFDVLLFYYASVWDITEILPVDESEHHLTWLAEVL